MNVKHLCAVTALAFSLAACSMDNNDNRGNGSATSSVDADALTALQNEVRDLQAAEAIRALFADYDRTFDERDFDALGKLFAADSEFIGRGPAGIANGPTEIAALLERAIMANPSGVTGVNLHIYSNEKIEVSGDTAVALSRGAFIAEGDTGQPEALVYATYRDQFVREGGAWKFKRREVIGDIPAPEPEAK